ncbi:acyltransferase family protein [Umezawaea beigongshangensis]|uniref:acyltransferase family protein n=1 Tax=Umezawaea beigongshangensis TaxID=2780383 RepID=UPI0018F2693E|nr:acyltransferase [Umezawaea beigongshangensis]
MVSPESVSPGPPVRPTEKAVRLPSLTGLRFIAAMLVFLFHITVMMPSPIPPNALITPFGGGGVGPDLSWLFSRAGYVGVSFFFILSGFVLTWSARDGEAVRPFWRRRMLKIFPNHVVMWAATLLLFASAVTPWTAYLPNLLLVHGFFPQVEIHRSINVPSWTLCCELLFYLLFPVLLRGVRRIADRRLWTWAGLAVLGMVALQLVNQYLVPGSRSSGVPLSDLQFWFGYVFPPSRLFEFVLGIVLARIVAVGRWPSIGVLPAALLTVVGYAVALHVPVVWGFNVVTAIPLGVLICAAATADVEGARTALRGRTMQWLGDVSFGFYLCQGVVVIYGGWLLRGAHDDVTAALISLVLLVATLVVGALLFFCVERPVMRGFAGGGRTRRPARVTAETTA